MVHAGQVLKKIREERGFTQKQAVRGVCSSSLLSTFERGKDENSSLTFDKLFGILKNLGVSSAEFEYVLNGYKSTPFFQLMDDAGKLFASGNHIALEQLLEEERKKIVTPHDKLTCLMLKNMLSEIDSKVTLSKDEKDQIINYLALMDYWGYYELTLYGNAMRVFDACAVKNLSNDMIARSAFYINILQNRSLVASALVNTVIVLIGYDEIESALAFNQRLKELANRKDIFHKTLHLFNEGTLDFILGNKQEGEQKMLNAIDVFKYTKCFDLVKVYHQNYEGIVEYYGK